MSEYSERREVEIKDIEAGELGSKENPLNAPTGHIDTIVSNSWVLASKANARAHFIFQGNIFSISPDYEVAVSKPVEERHLESGLEFAKEAAEKLRSRVKEELAGLK